MNLIEQLKKNYNAKQPIKMPMDEYLQLAKKSDVAYISSAERLLKAIGEPEILDTAKDARLSRIFSNRIIKTYKPFANFYGMEDVIERIVSFLKHAAQGLEESRQILYLLGPVGSAKSSLAECLKTLIEQEPIYVLADEAGNPSPIWESPLGLFTSKDAEDLGIPARYLNLHASPWALKRLDEYKGDISKFTVLKVHPSQDKQIACSKTEPGDENNQDISALVGKLDIRQLEHFSQNDADAYNYSGALGLSNQGLLEFVEMFKSPIKVLHPLLTATQEKNYKGTESIGVIPFDGVIVSHSNQSEWEEFKNNKNNEAFLDRIYIVEVPYCTRVEEEISIYRKLLNSSTLISAPCAPGTLEMLAKFSILTRLSPLEDKSSKMTKMDVYNGENVKEREVHAKSLQEYKDLATFAEGFSGFSTRSAYKALSEVFNYDNTEIAADPIHLNIVLRDMLRRERLSSEVVTEYTSFINQLAIDYKKVLEKDIQTAYMDSYDPYGQSQFDRYITYADHWVQDNDYRDADTGQMYDRDVLNAKLEELEKPARIANPKDFRHEVVTFALRYQAKHGGKNPDWKAYEKLRLVIEENMFKQTKELLPVISFVGQGSKEDQKKHKDFVKRMCERGYTERQVIRLVEWYNRYQKAE